MDRRRSLAGVPVLNRDVKIKTDPDGRVILTVRRRRGTGILAIFQPPVWERNVRLDEVGSFVFGLVDGERDTRKIIDMFVEKYRANRREAELSTVAFLKSLVQRGVISIVVPRGLDRHATP